MIIESREGEYTLVAILLPDAAIPGILLKEATAAYPGTLEVSATPDVNIRSRRTFIINKKADTIPGQPFCFILFRWSEVLKLPDPSGSEIHTQLSGGPGFTG
ncbi:hypothetical protein ACFL6N_07700, partial [Thermodesulfobacteriota bacterium]